MLSSGLTNQSTNWRLCRKVSETLLCSYLGRKVVRAGALIAENRSCCKIKSYLQQHLSFFRRAIRGVPNITFFGSSEAGSCRKCDFCVQQTDLLKFCCSRKVISGCFRFKQCFPESSVSKPTAQFSDIERYCEDKKAGFVVGLPSGEESSEPVILF